MKPSILVVMLDFLVCSLLLFVIGTGGKHTEFATSAQAKSVVAEEFSATAMQTQQDEWNRDYEQQTLLTQLQSETAEKEQLRARLGETTATLAAREANLRALTEEKTRIEQAKAQTEQALAGVETQLTRVNAERERLQQEGDAAKEKLAGLQTEQSRLQQEKTRLEQHAQQLGQTVASQQATITSLSEEVRASQARVEAQLTDVATGQQQMATTLSQLDTFARTLPATIQKNVAGVHDEQQTVQQNLAALAEDVKGLQAGLNAEEKARLMQAVADVAKGQQDLQSRLDSLIKAGQNDQIGESLNNIEAGQDALLEQTTRLGQQIESIKAHGPGPYQAVKNARLELVVSLALRYSRDAYTARFKLTGYPPTVRVDGRTYMIAGHQTLGLAWWQSRTESDAELTALRYSVSHSGETATVTGAACVLAADPQVVAVELTQPPTGLSAVELAAPGAALQNDQRKLHLFKSTAAGLSFEVDAAPDLSDARYLIVKRPLRGMAAWFENPAYRPDTGDYIVTAGGAFVGIMVSRDKCFVLGKDSLLNCAVSIPLADKDQFQRAARQYSRVK